MFNGKVLSRFWAKVDKDPRPFACWEWTAGCLGEYGEFFLNGKAEVAHRVSWIIHNGPIPAGLLVLHDCPGGDNKRCVRPNHLKLGTHQDNMKDAVVKKQMSQGDGHHFRTNPACRPYGRRNGRYTHPESVFRGEDHPNAKLTNYQRNTGVFILRRKGWLLKEIAEYYGVSKGLIWQILRGYGR